MTTLTELSARLGSGARGRPPREALEYASSVARQVRLDGLEDDLAWTELLAPGRALPTVDPELLHRAWRVVQRSLDTSGPVTTEYGLALQVLRQADVPAYQASELLQRIAVVRQGALAQDELSLASWFLSSKLTYDAPELSAELVVELWQLPELRPGIASALAGGAQWPRRHRLLTQLAERSGRRLDGLLSAWLPAHVVRDVDAAVAAVTTRAELQQLLAALFAHLPPEHWLALYQALGGYADAACFLTELRRTAVPPKDIEVLRSLCSQAQAHYPDDKARLSWLRAALDAWEAV